MIDLKFKLFVCAWLGTMLSVIHFSTEYYKYIISIITSILLYLILIVYEKLYLRQSSLYINRYWIPLGCGSVIIFCGARLLGISDWISIPISGILIAGVVYFLVFYNHSSNKNSEYK